MKFVRKNMLSVKLSIVCFLFLLNLIVTLNTRTQTNTHTHTNNKSGMKKSLNTNDLLAQFYSGDLSRDDAPVVDDKLSVFNIDDANSAQYVNTNPVNSPSASTTSDNSNKPPETVFGDSELAVTAKDNSQDGSLSKPDFFCSGLLKIQSKEFEESNLFPPVFLASGKSLTLTIDKEDFRINKGYEVDKVGHSTKYFFFRMNQWKIFYSPTETDINVLDSMSIIEIVQLINQVQAGSEIYCLTVADKNKKSWNLCSKTDSDRVRWVCAIAKAIGRKDVGEKCPEDEVIPEEKDLPVILKPFIIIPLHSKWCNEKWNYIQTGKDWECFCQQGGMQSPIDLPLVDSDRLIKTKIKPTFKYEKVPHQSPITTSDQFMKLGENIIFRFKENLLRINHNNLGRVVTIDGTIYQAEEIVFHVPSEHTIGGKRFDMEIQILHFGITEGDIAKQLILCFMLEKKAGAYNYFLTDIQPNTMPGRSNASVKEVEIVNDLFIPRMLYSTDDSIKPEDINDLPGFPFYQYQGSVPFPPCSEETTVMVAAEPYSISGDHLQMFYTAYNAVTENVDMSGNMTIDMNAKFGNCRATQDDKGRSIYYYECQGNECKKPVDPTPPVSGHYEKVKQPAMQYFHVDSNNPSGIPNAFVVTPDEAKNLTEGQSVIS